MENVSNQAIQACEQHAKQLDSRAQQLLQRLEQTVENCQIALEVNAEQTQRLVRTAIVVDEQMRGFSQVEHDVQRMFTGLVEAVAEVKHYEPDQVLEIERPSEWNNSLEEGDSIAVDGVCLTLITKPIDVLRFNVAPETVRRTTFGTLKRGQRVNLERALKLDPERRVGGHFVQGHVDVTAEIKAIKEEKDAVWVTLKMPREKMRFVVEKGYVAVDGTSLTVCEVGDDWFSLMLVPFTQGKVGLGAKTIGEKVNVEVDIVGKYVEKMLGKVGEKMLKEQPEMLVEQVYDAFESGRLA